MPGPLNVSLYQYVLHNFTYANVYFHLNPQTEAAQAMLLLGCISSGAAVVMFIGFLVKDCGYLAKGGAIAGLLAGTLCSDHPENSHLTVKKLPKT